MTGTALALVVATCATAETTAADLLERLRSAPSDATAIVVDAASASRDERLRFLRSAAPRLSASALAGAVHRLHVSGDAAGQVWAVEILHHLPHGHEFRLLGLRHFADLARRGDAQRVVQMLDRSSDDDLLATFLRVLVFLEKDPPLAAALLRIATGSRAPPHLRALAARALAGARGRNIQRRLLRTYAKEKDPRVRAGIIDALGADLEPRHFAMLLETRKRPRKPWDRYGDDDREEIRALLRLADRLGTVEDSAGACLAFIRDTAIYEEGLEERLLAVRTLARFARHADFARVVGEIQTLQIEDPAIRIQMWMMLLESLVISGAPEAKKLLIEATSDPHLRVRLTASSLLRHYPADDVRSVLARLLDDPAPQVVSSALWTLYEAAKDAVITTIIDRLDRIEKAGALPLADAFRILSLITGERRDSAAAWREWHRKGGRGAARSEHDPRAASGAGRTVVRSSFFRHRVESHRPLFVLDVSDSMRAKLGFFTRLEMLYIELERALRSLDQNARFSLIAFSKDAMWLPGGPRAPTEESVQEALAFLRAAPAGGGTNYHNALKAALQAADHDTVYFLSDGLPTAGDLKEPEELLSWFRKENAGRRLIINTIGIGGSDALLRRLSAESHGIYRPMTSDEIETF